MDKLDMKTKSEYEINCKLIESVFPDVIVDGNVDIEMLKEKFVPSENVVKEKYELTWPGKKESKKMYSDRINNTLRPKKNNSVNYDSTKNIFISGDNLDTLLILQESYLNKIKCIYIDPPYNTGNDFIYNDNYKIDSQTELYESGQIDELGNRLITNTSSNGRFHSDWLSMMYPRIKLARNLLKPNGIIFISIDDNELANLRKICDEIFGEKNFIAQMNIITGANQSGEGVLIQKNVEYCLIYGKSIEETYIERIDKTEESYRNLNDAPSPLSTRLDMGYTIYYNPNNKDLIADKDYNKQKVSLNTIEDVYSDNQDLINKGYIPIRPGFRNGMLHRWRWGIDTFNERKNDIVIFEQNGRFIPKFKQSGFNAPKNIQNFSGGASDLKKLFGEKTIFDYPKSVNFIKYILDISTSTNDLVLDFFCGSGTTAHAAMLLNAEKNKNIKYIMVQLPEEIQNKNGNDFEFKTISELAQERIRRAAKKIKEETNADIDYGFRLFEVDSSNMKDVYYKPNEIRQEILFDYMTNIKEDRTPEDILTQVILDLGLTLDLKIEEKQIKNNKVYYVSDNALVACFDDQIDVEILDTICECKPLKLVFKDVSFKTDKDKINLEERIKKNSPETEISIL